MSLSKPEANWITISPVVNCKYSDLTIKCGQRSWKAHKIVVWPQSEFVAKACGGSYKVFWSHLKASHNRELTVA